MSIGINYILTTNATTMIDKKIDRVITDDNIDSMFLPISEGIGQTGEPYSRWDSDTALKELSLMFPNVVFILDAQSEEGTLYRDYFYNGKMQISNIEIVYSPFDKTLLVD